MSDEPHHLHWFCHYCGAPFVAYVDLGAHEAVCEKRPR